MRKQRSLSCLSGGSRDRKPVNKRKRKRKLAINNTALVNLTQETSVKLENDTQTSTSAITNNVAPIVRNIKKAARKSHPVTLFTSLCYSEDALSALPNRTWAIHSTETPEKRVVVSAMMLNNFQGMGLAPLYIKQIIFDEKLNFDVLLVNSRIVLKDKPSTICTMHDFEDLLEYVDSLKVCAGGPPISQYGNINPECAYRDSMNNWRHNLCSLEIDSGQVCESCNSLDEILRRHAQRTKTTVKSAGKRKR